MKTIFDWTEVNTLINILQAKGLPTLWDTYSNKTC